MGSLWTEAGRGRQQRSSGATKRMRGAMRTGAGTLGPGVHGGGASTAALVVGWHGSGRGILGRGRGERRQEVAPVHGGTVLVASCRTGGRER